MELGKGQAFRRRRKLFTIVNTKYFVLVNLQAVAFLLLDYILPTADCHPTNQPLPPPDTLRPVGSLHKPILRATDWFKFLFSPSLRPQGRLFLVSGSLASPRFLIDLSLFLPSVVGLFFFHHSQIRSDLISLRLYVARHIRTALLQATHQP